jgi:hypothetical protein
MNLLENVGNSDTWKRGLAILAFWLIFTVAEVVVWTTVLFQFLCILVLGEPIPRLREFSQQLSTYVYQVLCYITFNSDDMPFPFADWPSGPPRR